MERLNITKTQANGREKVLHYGIGMKEKSISILAATIRRRLSHKKIRTFENGSGGRPNKVFLDDLMK